MSYNPRRILRPSRKRKEREVFPPSTSAKPLVPPTAVSRAVSGTSQAATASSRGAEPDQPQPLSSNRLLAGYMAHEFLTRGTLFGQMFDPAVPVGSVAETTRRNIGPGAEAEPSCKPKPRSYAEVASLLKSDGAHVPGVVNPTQLARWIQM